MRIKALSIVTFPLMIPALLGAPVHDRRALEPGFASGFQEPVNKAALHMQASSQLQGRSQSPASDEAHYAVGGDTSRPKDEHRSIIRRAPPGDANPSGRFPTSNDPFNLGWASVALPSTDPPRGPGRPPKPPPVDPSIPVHPLETTMWKQHVVDQTIRRSPRLAVAQNGHPFKIPNYLTNVNHEIGRKRVAVAEEHGKILPGLPEDRRAVIGPGGYDVHKRIDRKDYDNVRVEQEHGMLSAVHIPDKGSKQLPESRRGADGKFPISKEERFKLYRLHEADEIFDLKPASPKTP